jgi:hypothetical protein
MVAHPRLAIKMGGGQEEADVGEWQPSRHAVIPGRALARTRNLEIPGLVLRTIPE